MKVNVQYALALLLLVVTSGCFRNPETSQNSLTKDDNSSLFKNQNFELNTVEDLYNFFTYTDNSYPLISAHRGGPSKDHPENSIEAFSRISDKMPAIIECDVRLTKDSVLVLMHDETLDRTTTGTGKVGNFTLAELKILKLKDTENLITPYHIPTLEEALIWGNGKVIFTLDVKNDVPYQLLSNTIEKVKAKPYSIVITYNAQQARALNRINPDLMLSVSIKNPEDLTRLAKNGIPDNRIIAFVGVKQPAAELVTKLHQHGIKIILGTIGNLDRQAESKGYQSYAQFIENGSDILSTDRPLEAQKALDYYIRKRKITSSYVRQ